MGLVSPISLTNARHCAAASTFTVEGGRRLVADVDLSTFVQDRDIPALGVVRLRTAASISPREKAMGCRDAIQELRSDRDKSALQEFAYTALPAANSLVVTRQSVNRWIFQSFRLAQSFLGWRRSRAVLFSTR